MTLAVNANITDFDPYGNPGESIASAWMEYIDQDEWTLPPSSFPYNILFRPNAYLQGNLVDDWEFTNTNILVMHVHQGIYWQNISPANGREFAASDLVFDYDRMYGLGSGMTPSPFWSQVSPLGKYLTSVVATDKFTATFTFNISNPEFILESMEPQTVDNLMVNPEAVTQYGNLNNWHSAIGTGPFILTDFVDGSSASLIKNSNYWGTDERYPQNKLPYIDKINVIVIPTEATALAAMSAGKIDFIDAVSVQGVKQIQNTNPQILLFRDPDYVDSSVDIRNDKVPFNNINVRIALQEALDLPTIAASYYDNSVPPYPLALSSYSETGYGFPYSEWPDALKAQYAYNPTNAKALLAAAGYPNGFNTDIVAVSTCPADLLQIIQSYFAAINVNMSITTMDPASWGNYVQVNHKNDALSIWSAGQLGFTFEFAFQLGQFTTGSPNNFGMVNDPVWNAFQTQALAATSTDAFKQVIENANEYVAEQHFAISLLQTNQNSLCQPWLKGYSGQSDWSEDIIGGYGGRFWIDYSSE